MVQVSAMLPKSVDLSLLSFPLPDNILPSSAVHLEWDVSVVAHEAAIAFDIGTGNGSEFSFHLLCGHGIHQGFVGRSISNTMFDKVY